MSSHNRLEHLDGIRGGAAFSVFVAHCIEMLPMGGLTPLWVHLLEKVKWLAVPAVDTFFVLSGFCLMYSVERKPINAINASQFITKRILRIYPTYLAAVLLAFLARQLVRTGDLHPAISEWFQRYWSGTITLQDMVDHLVLILPFNSSKLNPVIWTLSVEMRMSLVFPAIAWLLNADSKAKGGIALLVVCVLVIGLSVSFLIYLPLFALGAAVAKHRDLLLRRVPRSLWVSGLILGGAGLTLVLVRSTIWPEIMAQARFVHLGIGLFSAYLILLSTSNPRLNALLRCVPMLFLGKISYSFYLIHFPLLLSITLLLAERVPIAAIWGIGLLSSLAFAWLSYRSVELPSRRLGRLLSDRLERFVAVCETA